MCRVINDSFYYNAFHFCVVAKLNKNKIWFSAENNFIINYATLIILLSTGTSQGELSQYKFYTYYLF